MILEYKCQQMESMTEETCNSKQINHYPFFRYLVLLQQVLMNLRPRFLYCDSRDCQIYLIGRDTEGFLSLREGIAWKLVKPSHSHLFLTQALRSFRANRSLLPG